MERYFEDRNRRKAEEAVKAHIEKKIADGFILNKVVPSKRDGKYAFSVFMRASKKVT